MTKVLFLHDCAGVGLQLKRGLEKRGVDVTLHYFGKDPYLSYGSMRIKEKRFRLTAFLLQEILKHDIIHYHQGPVQPNIPLPLDYLLAKAVGKRVVVHYHGEIRENQGEKYRKLSYKIMNKNGVVLVPTPDLLEWIPQAVWFRNPVDPTVFKPSGKSNHDTIRILHPSTQEWRKGTETVEKVVTQLKREGYKLELKIVGERNPVKHEFMPCLFNWADIVIDQLVEGFYGITSVEAMMCEKPVVCYWKYPNYADPPFFNSTVESLADNLWLLIESPEMRAKLGREGREWAIEHHATDKTVERLLEIYNN